MPQTSSKTGFVVSSFVPRRYTSTFGGGGAHHGHHDEARLDWRPGFSLGPLIRVEVAGNADADRRPLPPRGGAPAARTSKVGVAPPPRLTKAGAAPPPVARATKTGAAGATKPGGGP